MTQTTRADEREKTQDAARPLGASGKLQRVQHGVDLDSIDDAAPLPCADIQTVREALEDYNHLLSWSTSLNVRDVPCKALSALERIEGRLELEGELTLVYQKGVADGRRTAINAIKQIGE